MKYLNVSNVKALGARGQQQAGASPLLAGSKPHNPTQPDAALCRRWRRWLARGRRLQGLRVRERARAGRWYSCPSRMPACILNDQRPCLRCCSPDHVALYYSERTSKGAATAFAPLRELLNRCAGGRRIVGGRPRRRRGSSSAPLHRLAQ